MKNSFELKIAAAALSALGGAAIAEAQEKPQVSGTVEVATNLSTPDGGIAEEGPVLLTTAKIAKDKWSATLTTVQTLENGARLERSILETSYTTKGLTFATFSAFKEDEGEEDYHAAYVFAHPGPVGVAAGYGNDGAAFVDMAIDKTWKINDKLSISGAVGGGYYAGSYEYPYARARASVDYELGSTTVSLRADLHSSDEVVGSGNDATAGIKVSKNF
jgi:hypothetical protein